MSTAHKIEIPWAPAAFLMLLTFCSLATLMDLCWPPSEVAPLHMATLAVFLGSIVRFRLAPVR